MSESRRTESERDPRGEKDSEPKFHVFFRGERLAVPPELERKFFDDVKRESKALNHED